MNAKEFREMNIADLDQKRGTLKKELVELKLRHSGGQIKNPLKIREVRRDIARINGIIAEKK